MDSIGPSVLLVLVIVVQAWVTAAVRPEVMRPGTRRFPVGAAGLWLVVLVPSVLQNVVPALLDWWERDPDRILWQHEYWRLVTALTVQDGGLLGTVTNLVALAVVGVFADRFWGHARTATIFLGCGVLLNVLGTLAGYPGAGNSGATLALGASMAGLGVRRCRGRRRLLVALPVVAGAVVWALGDYHGTAVLLGALVGAFLPLPVDAERS